MPRFRYEIIRLLQFLFVSLGLVFLSACKADQPRGVISDEKMEDILYDYHIAQSLAKNRPDSVGYAMHSYVQAVFLKHGVTQADFDRSLEWYTRHSERLFKIYQRIDERYAAVTSSSGGDGKSKYANMKADGDTVNVWSGNSSYLLMSSGDNRMTFQWTPDTSLHRGDCILLHFSSQWFYREGMKSAIAQVSVRYDNDSVAVINRYIYSSGAQDIYMNTDAHHTVKQIKGFIYQEADWSDRPKILYISDFALVRLRNSISAKEGMSVNADLREDVPVHEADNGLLDSRSRISAERKLRDSLLANDSIEKTRSHFKEIESPQPMMRQRRMRTMNLRRQ